MMKDLLVDSVIGWQFFVFIGRLDSQLFLPNRVHSPLALYLQRVCNTCQVKLHVADLELLCLDKDALLQSLSTKNII
jgi:hypothetical protein